MDSTIDCWAFSDAIDPFGDLNKAGIASRIGVFVFDEVEMISCKSERLSFQEIKNLFNRQKDGSCRARYAQAVFPSNAPILASVNSGKGTNPIDQNMAWFQRQGLDCVRALLDPKSELDKLTEDEKGVLRRMAVVCVPDVLYDVKGANDLQMTDTTAQLDARMQEFEWSM